MLHLYLVSTLVFLNAHGEAYATRTVSTQLPEITLPNGARDVNSMVDICRSKEDTKGHLDKLKDGTYVFVTSKCDVR